MPPPITSTEKKNPNSSWVSKPCIDEPHQHLHLDFNSLPVTPSAPAAPALPACKFTMFIPSLCKDLSHIHTAALPHQGKCHLLREALPELKGNLLQSLSMSFPSFVLFFYIQLLSLPEILICLSIYWLSPYLEWKLHKNKAKYLPC